MDSNYKKWLLANCKTKNDFLQTIIDIGFDYDGYSSPDKLKQLIDEIVEIAKIGKEVG